MITEKNTTEKSQSEVWFSNIISSIKTDKLMYDTDTLHPDKKQLYDDMMEDNWLEVVKSTRKLTSKMIIPNMINTFVNALKGNIAGINKLAFEMSDSKILVWAEIKEYDEVSEDALIMAEATVNAMFTTHGFRLLTTIVEDCDNLPIPENFKELGK